MGELSDCLIASICILSNFLGKKSLLPVDCANFYWKIKNHLQNVSNNKLSIISDSTNKPFFIFLSENQFYFEKNIDYDC